MQRLFEMNVNQAADALARILAAEIIFTSAPYIFYKKLKLDDNYQTYLEGAMLSERVLRTELNLHLLNLWLALSLEL